MPYNPRETWTATPEKTNHLTRGWYHKTLFTFQNTNDLAVAPGDDIIATIISDGRSYKGSNELPAYYFADNNNDTGRGFKITIYYKYLLDNSKTGLKIGLRETSGGTFYSIDKQVQVASDSSEPMFVKAQFYCTSFYDTNTAHTAFQINGELMFSNKASQTNDVYMIPYWGALELTAGLSTPYSIQARNYSDNNIYILYCTIEEIG